MNSQSNKAQLREEIAGLLHNIELLKAENDVLRADNAKLHARLDPAVRSVGRITGFAPPVKPKYEWDPRIEGDFKRALMLAKLNNGIAVRART